MRELALKERAKSARKSKPFNAADGSAGNAGAAGSGEGGDAEVRREGGWGWDEHLADGVSQDPIALAEESFWSMVDPEYYEKRNASGATQSSAPVAAP